MKKTKDKIINFFKKDALKLIFITIFVLIFLIFFLNQNILTMKLNGFSSIFDCNLQVYFLDVGQSNSTLIVFPNKQTMLVDTGEKDNELKFLSQLNTIFSEKHLSKIDFLVLSHSDDEAVGGTKILFENFKVSNVFRPKILSESEFETIHEEFKCVDTEEIFKTAIDTIYSSSGTSVSFVEDKIFEVGGAQVEFWACEKTNLSDTNYYCPFIFVDYQNKNFLLTSDANKKRQDEFSNRAALGQRRTMVNFLQVPKNGGASSLDEEFLSLVSPKIAVVSAGKAAYPKLEVVKMLNEAGVLEIYSTNDGMIGIGVENDGKYFVKTNKKIFDMPFILTLLVCFGFVLLKAYDEYEIFKNSKISKFSFKENKNSK